VISAVFATRQDQPRCRCGRAERSRQVKCRHRVYGHDGIAILGLMRCNALRWMAKIFRVIRNKIESVSLITCPYDYWLTNKAYLSAVTVINISQSFYQGGYIFYAGASLAGAGYCRQCRRRPAILPLQLRQGCQDCVKISAQRLPRVAQFNACWVHIGLLALSGQE